MPRRCPICGSYNSLGAIKCKQCQNSIEFISQEDQRSLKDIRGFGIIFLITAIVAVSEFALSSVNSSVPGSGLGFWLASILNGLSYTNLTTGLTTTLLILEAVSVLALFVECVSFIYLRSSFIKLKKFDYNFSTPLTGTTLLIVGIVMAIIGLGTVLAFIFPLLNTIGNPNATPSNFPVASLGAILFGGFFGGIGLLLLVIGYIMGVLLGLHRLATKFEESFFDYALVLVIISVLFSPAGLIAAILVLLGVGRSQQRIKDSALEELMSTP